MKTYSWDNTQVVLVGNKCDMEEERAITYEQGQKLADQLGFPFFETSAKANINVRGAFDKLVDIICERMTDTIEGDPTLVGGAKPGTTNLSSKPNRFSLNRFLKKFRTKLYFFHCGEPIK